VKLVDWPAQIEFVPVISHTGSGLIGTWMLQVLLQLLLFVITTETDNVPDAPALTVIWFVFCPALIVPPVTVHT
jgi:hypothetical protein